VIAADTSAWIDFAKGLASRACGHLEAALSSGTLVMPLPVLFEVLSGPGLTKQAEASIVKLPRLEVMAGYWERAGEMRRKLLKSGLRARSMDCLIAQTCLDHHVPLIAADQDYRHFVKLGLELLS
jgi:predicted nucleic acid-binding protein